MYGYRDGPLTSFVDFNPWYCWDTDTIEMPGLERYARKEDFYCTWFHEAAHSTGHPKRLCRKNIYRSKWFSAAEKKMEEITAEMAEAFLCAHAGISHVVIENEARYVADILGKQRHQKHLVIQAAIAGWRAAEWILGNREMAALDGEICVRNEDALCVCSR